MAPAAVEVVDAAVGAIGAAAAVEVVDAAVAVAVAVGAVAVDHHPLSPQRMPTSGSRSSPTPRARRTASAPRAPPKTVFAHAPKRRGTASLITSARSARAERTWRSSARRILSRGHGHRRSSSRRRALRHHPHYRWSLSWGLSATPRMTRLSSQLWALTPHEAQLLGLRPLSSRLPGASHRHLRGSSTPHWCCR